MTATPPQKNGPPTDTLKSLDASLKAQQANAHFVRFATIFYGVMAVVGYAVMRREEETFARLFPFVFRQEALLLGLLAAGVLITGSYALELTSPKYRLIKTSMTVMLGRFSYPTVLYLAFLSSIAEEILFRGAIQPFAGVAITSILFGLLHLGPTGKLSLWTFWAVGAGFVLGSITEHTNQLWPAILCHLLVNSISLVNFRRQYLKINKTLKTSQGQVSHD